MTLQALHLLQQLLHGMHRQLSDFLLPQPADLPANEILQAELDRYPVAQQALLGNSLPLLNAEQKNAFDAIMAEVHRDTYNKLPFRQICGTEVPVSIPDALALHLPPQSQAGPLEHALHSDSQAMCLMAWQPMPGDSLHKNGEVAVLT